MSKVEIRLTVNGKPQKIKVEPYWTLLYAIRDVLGLTGTKEGCGNGECGACTVIMDGKPVPSCLVPAIRADGKSITTIEGLHEEGRLHPIQEAFVKESAIQCGFCTPGIVLTVKAFLERNPHPSEEAVREAIKGNICRCTGYAKYVAAIMKLAHQERTKG
jgi:carbon-monoxide dehydrogenase small subunit